MGCPHNRAGIVMPIKNHPKVVMKIIRSKIINLAAYLLHYAGHF